MPAGVGIQGDLRGQGEPVRLWARPCYMCTVKHEEGRRMKDITSGEPLRVSGTRTGGALLDVPQEQLDEVRQLLDRHSVNYWVDEELLSFNNGPFMGLIIFPRGTDPKAVQVILDSVP